jgi:hypothetical protein
MVWRWHRGLGPWALHIWPLSCYLSWGLNISENLCEGPMKVDVSTAGFVSVLDGYLNDNWWLTRTRILGPLVYSHMIMGIPDPQSTSALLRFLQRLFVVWRGPSLVHHPCFSQAWNREICRVTTCSMRLVRRQPTGQSGLKSSWTWRPVVFMRFLLSSLLRSMTRFSSGIPCSTSGSKKYALEANDAFVNLTFESNPPKPTTVP